MGTWSDEYITGIDLCDEQHKELFRILDRCIDLSKQSKYLDRSDEILQVIDELINYTIYHFDEEEKFMLEMGYKKFFSHKVQHDTFIKQIKEFEASLSDENEEEQIREILKYILDWISEHILIIDKNIKNNLKVV